MRCASREATYKPNLGLLEMEPYQDGQSQDFITDGGEDYLRLTWLTPPRDGRRQPTRRHVSPFRWRYREGGSTIDWGITPGGTRTCSGDASGPGLPHPVLRHGNERPRELSQGFRPGPEMPPWMAALPAAGFDDYAVDPLPFVFGEMSAEDMALSFYALGPYAQPDGPLPRMGS